MSAKEGDKEGSWKHIDFDELEVGDQIGGGGVGVIYKGWWGREAVALKTLFDARIGEEQKQEYMDELLVMSKVSHSNIVKFYGACMKPPNLCFVMELCDCSLHHLLHVKKMSYSQAENMQMTIDVASAMEYLHNLKPAIIHRDLKALNILRSHEGSLKICDFGLVKVRNTTAGTPAYMAPELLENKPYNKSVDVYAFGMVFWEIFCAQVPHRGLSVADIRDKVLAGERPHVPSYAFNSRSSALLKYCWHQSSDKRPNFTTIMDELEDIEASIPKSSLAEGKSGFGDTLDGLMSHK